MKSLKQHPYYLILLVLFFCLHGCAENFGFITLNETFFTGLSVFIATILLFGIAVLIFHKYLYASLITFFVALWVFFFGVLHDFVKNMPFLSSIKSYSTIIPILLLLTIIWVLFLRRKQNYWQKLTLYFNMLLIIYCSIDIIKIGYFSFAKEQNNVSVNFKYDEVKAKPDVYFLLFDGYPGQKSLMDSFNFDNKSMYDFLEKESFVNLKISANYDYTLFSMSSLFNMRYVPLGYTLPEPIQRDFQKRQAEIKEAQVFTIFEKMGYKIINNSIFDIKNSAGISEKNSFILGHKLLLTDKILFNRIDRDIGVGILDNIAKRIPFLIDHSFFSRRENNANVENKMSKTLSEKETPVFCYAHFLLPHEPYFYDSLGKEISKDTIEIQSWRYKPAFISYLKYSNTVIKKMINSIREKKPNAIIILMSDHGFRSFNSEAMYQEARFNNICSVYFPNKNYSTVSERITNINFFPFFFNAQFNQHLPYLKDTLIPMLH